MEKPYQRGESQRESRRTSLRRGGGTLGDELKAYPLHRERERVRPAADSEGCNPIRKTTDPYQKDVKWHGDSRERCADYRFNTKVKHQLFCPKCGTSIGIDFRDTPGRTDRYGISVSLLAIPPRPVQDMLVVEVE